jgi:virulence factor Mce-like protein
MTLLLVPSPVRGLATSLRRKLLGLLMLALMVGSVAFCVGIYNKALPWQKAVQVRIQVDRIGHQLLVPADVMVRGVEVGQVRGVQTNGRFATLDVALQSSMVHLIPANVTAQILPETLFGEKYVDLTIPPHPSTTPIHSGQVIPQDRSRVAIETSTVFAHLVPLLKALHPAELNVALSNLATALSGRGSALGQNLTLASRYFASFDPHLAQFTNDLAKLGPVAASYAAATPGLMEQFTNFSVNARSLVANQPTFNAFLVTSRQFADTMAAVLAQNASQLVRLAAVSRPVLGTLAEYSPEFNCFFRGLEHLQGQVQQTFSPSLQTHPELHIFIDIVKQSNIHGYKYPTDLPKYIQDIGPRCWSLPNAPSKPVMPTLPGMPYDSGKSSSPAPPAKHHGSAGRPNARTAAFAAALSSPSIGPVGSGAETAFIDALSAPLLGLPAARVSPLADLLAGPLLRGMAVGLS